MTVLEVKQMWSVQWRHNERYGVPNYQRHDCLLKCLSRCRSKKTSELCVTGLCEGNWPVTDDKGPVTRKMFPFDDVIMVAAMRCVFGSSMRSSYARIVCVDAHGNAALLCVYIKYDPVMGCLCVITLRCTYTYITALKWDTVNLTKNSKSLELPEV